MYNKEQRQIAINFAKQAFGDDAFMESNATFEEYFDNTFNKKPALEKVAEKNPETPLNEQTARVWRIMEGTTKKGNNFVITNYGSNSATVNGRQAKRDANYYRSKCDTITRIEKNTGVIYQVGFNGVTSIRQTPEFFMIEQDGQERRRVRK